MPTEKEMKTKALEMVPDLLSILMDNVREKQDIASARLIAEIAGVTKRPVGRPLSKPHPEDHEPSPKEIEARSKLADEVVDAYGG